MPQFTFPKAEHLVSNKDTEALFTSGSRAFTVFPVRAVFRKVEECTFPAMVMISVGKRHFRHAVDRNRAKRQIREAYRLHKHVLWDALNSQGTHLHMAFVWLSDEPVPSEQVETAVTKLLQIISEKL